MRRLVLQMAVSLDGIVAGPRSVTAPQDDQADQWKMEGLRDAGTHIMGRVTYLEMAAHWPSATDDFAAPMNNIPKVVFSKTLDKADWAGSQIARGDLTQEIIALKRKPGGDIIAHGGPTFVQELSRRGLVDVYRLLVKPGALGTGSPLFKDLPDSINLELLDARRSPRAPSASPTSHATHETSDRTMAALARCWRRLRQRELVERPANALHLWQPKRLDPQNCSHLGVPTRAEESHQPKASGPGHPTRALRVLRLSAEVAPQFCV